MKTIGAALLLATLLCSNSYADNDSEDKGVVLWQGFTTAMTPAMVAEEINKTGLDGKGDVTVNDMPKNAKFQVQGFNPIPVNTKNRLRQYSPKSQLELSGHRLSGPFFEFDDQDKLAQVTFRYLSNGQFVMPGCSGVREDIAADGLEFLTSALQNKYDLRGSGTRSDLLGIANNVRVFSDGSTRVWLEFVTKFEKTNNPMLKCDQRTTHMSLHYGDQKRISTLIEGIVEEKTQKAIDVL